MPAPAAAPHPDSAARGVWVPALTPLDADLTIDASRSAAHLRKLIDRGCHGIVLFGTTGEAASFSVDERGALLEQLLAAGLPADRLMVGTGCCALSDTVALTRSALRAGCPRVLMLPPFYYPTPGEDGLFRSYAEVIERCADTRLRITLYHFPRLSGVPLTEALIARLLRAFPGTIAGIKDSSGDWDGTLRLIQRFPELAVFSGSESFLLRALRAGGAGVISATANVNAPAMRELYDAWRAGGDVQPLQDGLDSVRGTLEAWPLIAALKHVLAHRYGDPEWDRLRPPLERLAAEDGRRVLASLAEHRL